LTRHGTGDAVGLDVRKATDADRPHILELIRKVLGEGAAERAERRWDWHWHQDPRLKSKGYQGLVVEWDGEMIASIAMVPAGLFVDGVLLPDAVWFTEALTHWGRLRRALRAARKDARLRGEPESFKGPLSEILDHPLCPRQQLGKHLTRAMQVVAYRVGSVDQPGTGSWARNVSYQGLLGQVLGRPIGRPIGALLDFFAPEPSSPDLPVQLMEGRFDARFDALFENAVSFHRAITRRDAAYLNWRYRHNPDGQYDVLVSETEGQLLGYLIVGLFERHGQPRAHVLDVLVLDDDPDVAMALFAAALRRLRRQRIARLECYTGSSMIRDVLEHYGFRQRLEGRRPMRTLVRRIDVPELYITRGDGDGG
jgi:hypothetical protein